MRKAFLRRRDLIVSLAKEIPDIKINVPDGAFYIFPDLSAYIGKSFKGRKIAHSADLAMYLLEEGHVASVGGLAFGAPDCVRFSYATSDESLIEAMTRVKKALLALE
jgi:aspartate aminotransferase